jgi:serine/threonine-protein kinase
MQAKDTSDALLLTVLGRYRLVSRLGAGGMASVYKGIPEDSLDQSQAVAVKVMHPQFAGDAASRKRFRREIEIYRDLSHPNLLRLEDFGEQDGILFLVVELLQGKTLRQLLGDRKLSLEEILGYVTPLAAAMDYAHGKQIIHRDLKPDNVFHTEQGRLVVMDFGIARGGEYTQATATGQGLGTAEYMAPEQVQGRPQPASDLYSFGVMLFEMLAGALPFEGPDPMSVAFMQVGQQPPDLATLRPDLPAQVAEVVARLLSKNPQKRFATFAEAVAALR